MLGNLTSVLHVISQVIVIYKNKTACSAIQYGIIRKICKALGPFFRKCPKTLKTIFFENDGLLVGKNNGIASKTFHGRRRIWDAKIQPPITFKPLQRQRRSQECKASTRTPHRERKKLGFTKRNASRFCYLLNVILAKIPLPFLRTLMVFIPQIGKDTFDSAAGDDGEARVAFAHDRLVDRADG